MSTYKNNPQFETKRYCMIFMFLVGLSIPSVFLVLTANESSQKPFGSFRGGGKNQPRKIKESGLIQSRGVGLGKGCELGDVGSRPRTVTDCATLGKRPLFSELYFLHP